MDVHKYQHRNVFTWVCVDHIFMMGRTWDPCWKSCERNGLQKSNATDRSSVFGMHAKRCKGWSLGSCLKRVVQKVNNDQGNWRNISDERDKFVGKRSLLGAMTWKCVESMCRVSSEISDFSPAGGNAEHRWSCKYLQTERTQRRHWHLYTNIVLLFSFFSLFTDRHSSTIHIRFSVHAHLDRNSPLVGSSQLWVWKQDVQLDCNLAIIHGSGAISLTSVSNFAKQRGLWDTWSNRQRVVKNARGRSSRLRRFGCVSG